MTARELCAIKEPPETQQKHRSKWLAESGAARQTQPNQSQDLNRARDAASEQPLQCQQCAQKRSTADSVVIAIVIASYIQYCARARPGLLRSLRSKVRIRAIVRGRDNTCDL